MRTIATRLAAVALAFAPALGAATELKIATIAPEGSAYMKALRDAAAEVATRTDGRVALRLYPGGAMGNESIVLRKMRVGQLHGGMFVAGTLASIDANVQVYNLPLLFADQAEVDAVRTVIDPVLAKRMKDKGFHTYGFINGGFAYLMSTKPIRTYADLAGMKTWIPEGDQIGQTLVEEVGLTPVPLPLPDVLTGLQTGLVDTVASPPVAAVALQWFTKAPNLVELPVIYSFGAMMLSERAVAGLDPADRAVLTEVLEAMCRRLESSSIADNEGARAALRKQGVAFSTVDEASSARWLEAAARAATRLERELGLDPALLARVRALIAEHRAGAGG